MQAQTISELSDLFEDAYAAKDAGALSGLFEDGAVLVGPGGDTLRGGRAIAGLAEQMWKQDLAYVAETVRVVEAGNVGLVVFRWSLVTPGGEVAERGLGSDVVRRQADGTWRYAIGYSDPAGSAAGAETAAA